MTRRFLWCVGCTLSVTGSWTFAQTYRYREVPLLSGALFGEATGVNNAGLAVGRCTLPGGLVKSWVCDPATGVVTELALPVHKAGNGVAGINDSGQAVGTIEAGGFNTGFVLSGVSAGTGGAGLELLTRDLTTLTNDVSVGLAINSGGQVAGRHSFQCLTGGPYGGAFWASGVATPTQVLTASDCGFAEARGLNDAGVVCGVAQTAFTSPAQTWSRPVIWNGTAMTTLSTPSASARENGFASDVNNAGVVVGYSENRSASGNPTVPCRWDSAGVLTVLDSLVPGIGVPANTAALSMNDAGDAVGYGPFNFGSAAVLWKFGGTAVINLNSSLTVPLTAPTVLARANSISNTGFIAGRTELSTGSTRGFVLEPCTPAIVAAPVGGEVGCGASLTLTCSAVGAGPFTYVWKRNGDEVGAGSTLSIAAFAPGDAGSYVCEVTGACGSASTTPAVFAVKCLADFDGSGGTPDAQDIDVFFTTWLAGDPAADADCSGGTPDGSDIDVFFTQWLAGGC